MPQKKPTLHQLTRRQAEVYIILHLAALLRVKYEELLEDLEWPAHEVGLTVKFLVNRNLATQRGGVPTATNQGYRIKIAMGQGLLLADEVPLLPTFAGGYTVKVGDVFDGRDVARRLKPLVEERFVSLPVDPPVSGEPPVKEQRQREPVDLERHIYPPGERPESEPVALVLARPYLELPPSGLPAVGDLRAFLFSSLADQPLGEGDEFARHEAYAARLVLIEELCVGVAEQIREVREVVGSRVQAMVSLRALRGKGLPGSELSLPDEVRRRRRLV